MHKISRLVHRAEVALGSNLAAAAELNSSPLSGLKQTAFKIAIRSTSSTIRTRAELEQLGNALLEPLFPVARGIRLLGVSLSSLAEEQAEREPEFSLPR